MPVKVYFSIWCFCVPLFITSVKLQSYVEALVPFTYGCAKREARKEVFAKENLQFPVTFFLLKPLCVLLSFPQP